MENQPGLKNFDKNIILFWPPTYMYTLYDYCACDSNVTLISTQSFCQRKVELKMVTYMCKENFEA